MSRLHNQEGAPAAGDGPAVPTAGRERRVPSRRLLEPVAVLAGIHRFFGSSPMKDRARLLAGGFAPGARARPGQRPTPARLARFLVVSRRIGWEVNPRLGHCRMAIAARGRSGSAGPGNFSCRNKGLEETYARRDPKRHSPCGVARWPDCSRRLAALAAATSCVGFHRACAGACRRAGWMAANCKARPATGVCCLQLRRLPAIGVGGCDQRRLGRARPGVRVRLGGRGRRACSVGGLPVPERLVPRPISPPSCP